MKVSSRADYALSCILRVADKHDGHEPVTVREVAEKEKLEPDYVEQMFVAMKKAGILKSLRGKSGGYVLARTPDKVTAKDVVKAIDKSVLELVCSRKKGRKNKCAHFNNCEIKAFWEELGEGMKSILKKYTLDKLLRLRRREKNWR